MTLMTTATKAYTLAANEGRALWHLSALMNFKALTAETDGSFWAVEGLADQHMAVPLHAHSQEDEVWYVLEGEIAFTVGSETNLLGPGSFVFVPRGTPHTFQIKSGTARWFGLGISGRLDQWFFETGALAQSLTLPPPAAEPPDIPAIVASLEVYGTDTLGPPPGMA
jgi:mannose-6-phosphate isomerase-like protein (cupin superfamily)